MTLNRLIMLPPKGRVTLLPPNDTTTEVPRIIIPEDPSQPPVFVPGPQPPTTPPAGTVFPEYNIYPELREVQSNLPFPALLTKTSQTFHWEGPDPIPVMTDAETIWYLKGINEQHIGRDWGNGQRGSGIMYHEAIAQSGATIIMRGAELVLWHSNNDEGNKYSRAVLVVCSAMTPPTPAQQLAIRQRAAAFRQKVPGAPQYPHGPHWTNTACPGDTIRSIVASL